MNYKALICDVDGTLIPLKKDALPSEKLKKAFKKASKKVHIGLATSRPLFVLHNILDSLNLTGPSIINGGAQILDTDTRKVLWEKCLNLDDLGQIHIVLKKMGIKCIVMEDDKDRDLDGDYIPKKPIQVWVNNIDHLVADQILDELSSVSEISINKVPSWKLGKIDLVINHSLATKQHGVFEIAKLLKIKTHEIIGIGDGYNDFPLLMACGLKVAMGNAMDELKEIADYIAPTVEEDGVVDVIERFVLNSK